MKEHSTSSRHAKDQILTKLLDITTNLQELQKTEKHVELTRTMQVAKSRVKETVGQYVPDL